MPSGTYWLRRQQCNGLMSDPLTSNQVKQRQNPKFTQKAKQTAHKNVKFMYVANILLTHINMLLTHK